MKIFCFLLSFISLNLCFLNQAKIKPFILDYDNLTIQTQTTKTQEEIINDVNKIFNYPNYVLLFEETEKNVMGKFYPALNKIIINNNISNLQLPTTLAHELVHKTFKTTNEKTTILLSLSLLLESNNDYLINSAKYEIKCQKYGLYKNLPEYDISDYLK